MQRDIAALNDCSMAVLSAKNGHGRRWAADRCVRALVANGTAPQLAERMARAAVVVAQAVDAKAKAARHAA